MNTFLHLTTQADQLRGPAPLARAAGARRPAADRRLSPGREPLASLDGRLEWDKTWPDPQTGAHRDEVDHTHGGSGGADVLHVTLIYDEVTRRRRLAPHAGAVRQRYLWRFEAELLLDKAGFALEALFGDWDLAPFEGASERMILVARRRR